MTTYNITINSLTLNIQPELPEQINRLLDKELSFFVEGAVFSNQYSKSGKSGWDGRHRLYNRKKQTTFTGLAHRVISILTKNNISVTVESTINFPKIDPTKYPISEEIQFRQYQKEAIIKALKQKRGIISLPTGAGKTITAGGIIGKIGCNKSLFLVPSIDLLYQTQAQFEKMFGQEIGIIGDSNFDIKEITVSSVQTLTSKLKQGCVITQSYLNSVELLIIDECHHVAADTIQEICFSCPAQYRYGISATPYRDDNQDLKIEAAIGKIFYSISPKELIDLGYLAQPRFYIYETPPNPQYTQHLPYQSAYKYHVMANPYRNQQILSVTEKLVQQDKSVLIIVNNIKHGEYLEQELLDRNIHTYFIQGIVKSEDRKVILEGLQNKTISVVVCTTRIGSEGLDIPSLDSLINAGAGKGIVLTLQKVGRTLRRTNTKDECILIDFYDQSKYFKKHAERRIGIFKEQYGEENVYLIPVQGNT